jgi:TolB-like protein/DNA-binding winged helix-turn-helix (wHTH) protein/predicted Zn-dependent protease
MQFLFLNHVLDTDRRELHRGAERIAVEPQVFDLLVFLLHNRDRMVSKDDLIASVWGGRIVSESTLTSRINAARRAVGDSGGEQKLIRTIARKGLRFVGDVRTQSNGSAPSGAAAPPPDVALPFPEGPAIPVLALNSTSGDPEHRVPDGNAGTIEGLAGDARRLWTKWRGGWVTRALIVAFAVLGVAAAPFRWGSVPARQPTALLNEASARTPPEPAMSIVVLPFVNLRGDLQQDYFADGITDSLTTDLSHALPGSFVVSRDTAFIYKGRVADVRRIGRELDVRYALSGSVMPDAERVRVNAELVDARAGVALWAERFDVERAGVLQVQDEIVGRLARAIGLNVVDAEARRSERERPHSADAADLVMRARAIANRPSSAANMIGARQLYEQALTMEADNIDALAGVATTLVFEALNGYYADGNAERLVQAETLLRRTLALEPRHFASLKANSAMLRAQGRFDDAIAAAQAVIAENPAEPWAYKEIGLSRMYLGRPGEALEWFAKADRFGPRDPGRWTWLDGRGQALILLGRDGEALRSLRLALDANPNTVSTHALLAAAYALNGQIDDARTALAAYDRVRPGERVADFRKLAPVPLHLTSPDYQRQRARLQDGLRRAGMPE